MSARENSARERRPEAVLASEAEKRISTADGKTGRPLDVPENTPRDYTTSGDITSHVDTVDQSQVEMADPGSERLEDILDEDEFFMTLTEEERLEWEAMIARRTSQMEKNQENHKNWADSFTRRRMFALSRIRKIRQSYEQRVELFSSIADRLKTASHKMAASRNLNSKKAGLEKRNSEPVLSKSEKLSVSQKPATSFQTKRNETMIGESVAKTNRVNQDVDLQRRNSQVVEDKSQVETIVEVSVITGNSKTDPQESGLDPVTNSIAPFQGKMAALKVEQVHSELSEPSTT